MSFASIAQDGLGGEPRGIHLGGIALGGVAVTGVSPSAVQAMGRYLDDLLCRR